MLDLALARAGLGTRAGIGATVHITFMQEPETLPASAEAKAEAVTKVKALRAELWPEMPRRLAASQSLGAI